MKESFDPLAEAQRRSDPQLVRYNETIGHDPSANADYAAYLRTRDFVDANDNVHDAKTSKFKKRDADIDPYETDLINSAHVEALDENALRDSSLDTLAKKVAEARQSGDKEAAAHAEDLFFDKFTNLSEKYGWEKDDESADETLHVNKDAKVGRTTIDDRLARYSKIMYGEEANMAVKSPEPVAEPEKPVAAEIDANESDSVEKESTSETEAKPETIPAAEEKAFDVNAEVEQAKERLNQHAEELEQQANEERNGSEAAKADRELIARVSKEGLEDLDNELRIKRVSTEGLEVEEDGEIPRVSTEGLEDEELSGDESTPEQVKSSRVKRAWRGFSDAFDRASAALGYGMTKASQKFLHRGGRKENETIEEYEVRQQKYGRRLILGTIAVAGAALTMKLASDIDLSDNNAHASDHRSGEGAKNVEEVINKNRLTDHLSREQIGDFKIPEGSGGEALMDRLGVDKQVWYDNQNEFLRKFPNEAYRMSDGNVGFADNGRLSKDAIKFWAKKSDIWH